MKPADEAPTPRINAPDADPGRERERRMAARLLEQSRLSQTLMDLRSAFLRQKRSLSKP